MEAQENDRSDKKAKQAYVEYLEKNGFTAKVINHPVDIEADKDGQRWYFEIKKTKHTDKYYGGATMNEWQRALKDPVHFRFVIAIDHEDGTWDFKEYTPLLFQEYSTIPPFKIYFNVNFEKNSEKQTNRKTEAVRMNIENFKKMKETFDKLKEKTKEC